MSTADAIRRTARLLLVLILTSAAAEKIAEVTNALEEGESAPLKPSTRQYPPSYGATGVGAGAGAGYGGNFGGGCPLCDSSVYSYCSYKVVHDACCCDFPAAVQFKPPQCLYYDCGLLYAKSCYEYMLIKNCCCNNPY